MGFRVSIATCAQCLNSLIQGRPNCGAYVALPWIKDILGCYEAARNAQRTTRSGGLTTIPLSSNKSIRSIFLLLLRLFEACLTCGLFTGKTSAADFEQLLRLLDYPVLPELSNDFTRRVLGGSTPAGPYGKTTQSLNESSVSFKTAQTIF